MLIVSFVEANLHWRFISDEGVQKLFAGRDDGQVLMWEFTQNRTPSKKKKKKKKNKTASFLFFSLVLLQLR